MHRYKDLKFWQLSRVFCKDIYLITKSFPSDEKFGLTSQLRRASVSIPSNIAEGASRVSNKDFARFLRISLGSCYEIETQLLISCDLDFIQKEELEKLQHTLYQIIKMMSRFISTLKI
ncbi:four helix bundle protein [Polaribacter undariae]|uniref:Four helix bundle protein n=1 Tax=Polaribacter sejongensis TaxID=985043 RepID=A0AAJ1VEJ7_9FLAO|nr:four helix bundle protein [Polaribacter undariae]MDN3618223.1 four helix bundle protein [Polaribacter undariae]UWD30789.1 four helix bundle protein [Polaribacter undariae]